VYILGVTSSEGSRWVAEVVDAVWHWGAARPPSRDRTWPYGLAIFVLFWLAIFALVAYGRRSTKKAESVASRVKRPEFPTRYVPRERVPAPLPLAEDAIGGIESLSIGAKRYWFGYSYKADAVLSPLIDDAKVMAQFASDHMLQTDGAHPPEYWEELVEEARNGSSLSNGPSDSMHTGDEVRKVRKVLTEARKRNAPAGACELSDHLVGLLEATSGDHWPESEDDELRSAFESLTPQKSCLSGALSVVSGLNPPPPGTTFTDALDVVADCIEHLRRTTPENWRTLLLHD
jgi:hypothetical protein